MASWRGTTALMLAAVYLIWGSTYLAMRVALEELPPFLMSGARFLLAGVLLYAFGRARGGAMPTRLHWRAAALLGGLFFVVGNGGFSLAMVAGVGSALAAVFAASMPLWAALLGAVVGRRPSWLELVGLLVGFGGIVLLRADGALTASAWGVAAVIVAPLGWAIGTVLRPRLVLGPAAMADAVVMIAGGAELVLIGVLRGERVTTVPSAASLLVVLYLVVFGSLIGFTAFSYLLRNASPATATSYAYVNPIVAMVLGVTIGHERIGSRAILAAVLVLGSVAVILRSRTRENPSQEVEKAGRAAESA